jgi:hypothetical protein
MSAWGHIYIGRIVGVEADTVKSESPQSLIATINSPTRNILPGKAGQGASNFRKHFDKTPIKARKGDERLNIL